MASEHRRRDTDNICPEIDLATIFREDRDAACAAAQPPSAGVVWWRAQRRLRLEAASRAARPISLVHGIALGSAAAAVVAILGLGLGGLRDSLGEWFRTFSWPTLPPASPDGFSGFSFGVLLLLAAMLLLAPVAIYLALSDE